MKRMRTAAALIAGACAVVAPVIILSGSSASAAVGTQAVSTASSGTFTATSDDFTFGDATAPTEPSIACGSSTVMGELGGDADSDLGTITSGVFAGCTDLLGDSWSVTILSGVAVGDSSSTGTISGEIDTLISVNGSVPGGACSFDVSGSTPFAYSSSGGSSGQASIGQGVAGLMLSNVTGAGCSLFGISDGDVASVNATYSVILSVGAIPEGTSRITRLAGARF